MKTTAIAAIAALTTLLSTAPAQVRTPIFVETPANGGLDGPGRGLTATTPLATLPAAMTLAQTVLANSQEPQVVIGPGSYALAGSLSVPAGTELLGREGPSLTTIVQSTAGQEVLRLVPGWDYGTNNINTTKLFGLTIQHNGGHGVVGYAGQGPGDTTERSLSARIERCIVNNTSSAVPPPGWGNFGAFTSAGFQFFNSDVGAGGILVGALNTGILILKDGRDTAVYTDVKILDNVIRNERAEEKIGIWVDSERRGGDRQRSNVIAWPATDVAIARNVVEAADTGIYVTSNCVVNSNFGCAPLIARNMLSYCAQAVTIHQRKAINSSQSQIFFDFVHNTMGRSASLVGVIPTGLLLWGNPAVRRIANNLFASDNAAADIYVADWLPYQLASAPNALNMGQNGWYAGVVFPGRPVNDGFPQFRLPGPSGIPAFLNYAQVPTDLRLQGYLYSVMNTTNRLLIDGAPALQGLAEAAVDLDGNSTAVTYQYTNGVPTNPNTPTDFGASESHFIYVLAGNARYPHAVNVQILPEVGGGGIFAYVQTNPHHPIVAGGSQANFTQAWAWINVGPDNYYSASYPGVTLRSGLLVDLNNYLALLPLRWTGTIWQLDPVFAGTLPPDLPPLEMQIAIDVSYMNQPTFTMTSPEMIIRTY